MPCFSLHFLHVKSFLIKKISNWLKAIPQFIEIWKMYHKSSDIRNGSITGQWTSTNLLRPELGHGIDWYSNRKSFHWNPLFTGTISPACVHIWKLLRNGFRTLVIFQYLLFNQYCLKKIHLFTYQNFPWNRLHWQL